MTQNQSLNNHREYVHCQILLYPKTQIENDWRGMIFKKKSPGTPRMPYQFSYVKFIALQC